LGNYWYLLFLVFTIYWVPFLTYLPLIPYLLGIGCLPVGGWALGLGIKLLGPFLGFTPFFLGHIPLAVGVIPKGSFNFHLGVFIKGFFHSHLGLPSFLTNLGLKGPPPFFFTGCGDLNLGGPGTGVPRPHFFFSSPSIFFVLLNYSLSSFFLFGPFF